MYRSIAKKNMFINILVIYYSDKILKAKNNAKPYRISVTENLGVSLGQNAGVQSDNATLLRKRHSKDERKPKTY